MFQELVLSRYQTRGRERRGREVDRWVLEKSRWMRTYLIVSEGVTAKIASIIPAPSPARRLRGALTFPLVPRSMREPIDRDHKGRRRDSDAVRIMEKEGELTSLSASASLNLS
jgi:hypothetical protein